MNFTAKIKDFIANNDEMKPFYDRLGALQSDRDLFLETNKGPYNEYTIEAFEELLEQEKAIARLQVVIASMEGKNQELENDILRDLALLQGGKLKLAIDDSSYLISAEGGQIHLGRAFD